LSWHLCLSFITKQNSSDQEDFYDIVAGIAIVTPVCGFLPVRAARSLSTKLSKGAVGFSVAAAMTIGALVAAIKNQFSVAAVMVVATFLAKNCFVFCKIFIFIFISPGIVLFFINGINSVF
jgi:hypothetical protein